jgi:hypothetical protein
MGFNNVGFGLIAPGESQRWGFRWGGSDQGAQWFGAHPEGVGISVGGPFVWTSAELVVFDHAKKLEADGSFTYFCSVRNAGPEAIFFSWQGGGF